jgi:putative Ca2+/H+ antiporter (TMEM165/GDT1 family)
MEALVPAFIAALLTQVGDRPAMLTAILADRYGRPLLVALAAGLAHAGGNAVAAGGALWIAPMLTPNAQALLIAIALLFAGLGALWPAKRTDRLEHWQLGSILTPLLAVFILALGDRTQFLTFALAARGEPWFAFAGATFGAFAVAFIAAVLGELSWSRLPFRAFRIATGLFFLAGAAWVGAGALRLI